MKLSYTLVLALHSFALALPQGKKAELPTGVAAGNETKVEEGKKVEVPAGVGTGNETKVEDGKKEEGEENEVELAGQFGAAINLNNTDIKTDVVFPPGLNGVFEVEFQNKDARILTVTENKTPAPPPTGFTALEPVSYKVALDGGADGLTLQRIDYILSANSTISKEVFATGKLGKLCTETNAFILDGGFAETEFEADENELKSDVKNMIGEWALFIPAAAAATPPAPPAGGVGAGAGAGAGAGNGKGKGAGAEAGAGKGNAGAGKGGAAGGAAGNANDQLKQLLEGLLTLLQGNGAAAKAQ